MNEYYNAFEISPVPTPGGPDAEPAEIHRGIYAMPMFVTVPTGNFAESVEFWTEGLGFVDLFSVPDQITHLRRWAFQDVLLVPGDAPPEAPSVTVTFACVLNQVDGIAAAAEKLRPGSTSGPRTTPWNTMDVEVITPENARVIMTAARGEVDPEGPEAAYMKDVGIEAPTS